MNFVLSLIALQTQCKQRSAPYGSLLHTLILASLLLASCAPLPTRQVAEPISQSLAGELMQVWYDNSSHVDSVQGLAKVKVHTPEKTLNGTQVILAEKPNRLRAETLSPFGSPLLLLAADGENLGVLLPGQNLFYTGAATPANLGRFVRIPLQLKDLVSLLLYQPPLIKARTEEAFKLLDEGWLLVRYNSQRRQELTFNNDRQLVDVSYYDKNELFLQLSYGNFAEEGERFPRRFGIELPEEQITASLKFSDLETNGTLRPDIFQLTPASGARIVSLDD